MIPVKIQLPLAEPCAAAPGESGLCPCQDFQCNSRCLSSALESLSITWNHRLKVCPHTDPSQATGFFNKGMKAGFCRLPGELRAPGSGRSRQSRFQQESVPGNRSPCPASSTARPRGAPAGTAPLPAPGDLRVSRNSLMARALPEILRPAASKQTGTQLGSFILICKLNE